MPATEAIEISDFRPGIFGDYHGSAVPRTDSKGNISAGNGAATIQNTFRCCADPSGALGPLPRSTVGRTETLRGTATSGFYPVNQVAMYLTDALLSGPVTRVGGAGWSEVLFQGTDIHGTSNFAGTDSVDVTVLWQYWYQTAGTGLSGVYSHYWTAHIYRASSGVTSKDIMFENSIPNTYGFATFPRQFLSGSLGNHRYTIANFPVSPQFVYAGIHVIVSDVFDHVNPGIIEVANAALTTYDTDFTTTYPSGIGFGAGWIFHSGFMLLFPSPPPAETPRVRIFGMHGEATLPSAPVWGISHQDRIVIFERTTTLMEEVGYLSDPVTYTAPLDPAEIDPFSDTARTTWVQDVSNGIGNACSLTTDQLFIVKHYGGALLVTGDLNNPSVQKLPFVDSTYGVTAQSVATPLGVVYGSRSGVYVWNNTRQTQKLSTQIEGFFWDHSQASDGDYAANRGRFEWWHPWVMVPNNFMYDTRTKSWWRLDEPAGTGLDYDIAPYNVYQTDSTTGKLYAFPYKITVLQNVVYHIYDPTILATSYSWQSQPIVETRNRQRSFQDVTLVASCGPGTVTTKNCTVIVTLTGISQDGKVVGPIDTTFTWKTNDGGFPVHLYRKLNVNFVAMNVQVKITADGNGQEAPKIHSLMIGTADRMRNVQS